MQCFIQNKDRVLGLDFASFALGGHVILSKSVGDFNYDLETVSLINVS